MKSLVLKLWKYITSLQLTILTLLLLGLTIFPATFIPQGYETSFYTDRYSGIWGNLILWLDYHRFYTSYLFLTVVALFWMNLFSCTMKRFFSHWRKKGKKRFGPDILHLGLLVLILGGLASYTSRKEGMVFLESQDALQLPSGKFLVLEKFEFLSYENNRPKNWISSGYITKSLDKLAPVEEYFRIEVNHPLRFEGMIFYQQSCRETKEPGVYQTGLFIVEDRSAPWILLAFAMISAGLFITIVQKEKGK